MYIYYFIEFLSLLPLKKYFLFLFLSPPSLLSSFFLLIFFLSLIYSLLRRSVLDLHLHLHLHHRSVLGSSSSPSHAADPSRPILHLTAHPTLTSLVLHLTADPSSIVDLSFIVDPSSINTTFIELKSTTNFVAMVGFRGLFWVS